MTQYIADEAHFKEVIARVPKVKRSLWIGTADIKDLYVEERPFLGLLADLIKKGKEVRLIHARTSGRTLIITLYFLPVWSAPYAPAFISRLSSSTYRPPISALPTSPEPA